jgi:hypothetical protein
LFIQGLLTLASDYPPWLFRPCDRRSDRESNRNVASQQKYGKPGWENAAQQVIEKSCKCAWLLFRPMGGLVIRHIQANLPACPPANSTKP